MPQLASIQTKRLPKKKKKTNPNLPLPIFDFLKNSDQAKTTNT